MIALKYTILAQDTLSSVANSLNAAAGVSYQQIGKANPDIDANALPIGALLNIPAADGSSIALKYTVMAGDSYSTIAGELKECAGMTYQAIIGANPGIDPNQLSIGQIVAIPQTSNPAPIDPDAGISGFWRWSWAGTSVPPQGTNLGIAFSGWTDPSTALQNCAHLKNNLPGSRYISLGGGNASGAFTSSSLASITASINEGAFSGYDGIAYDIEEGSSDLALLFGHSFAAAKANGYKVLVTVSHSAPYGISDANTLMQTFFADPNIDYLSPQLYTTGEERANDYATSGSVLWPQYANAKAAIVPSIVHADLYPDAQNYFQAQGVDLAGFVQWSQS